MLDNPLLTTVGSLIGVSGSILSYIMVRLYFPQLHIGVFTDCIVRRNESVPHECTIRRHCANTSE